MLFCATQEEIVKNIKFECVSSLQVVNDLVFSGSSDQSVHAHNVHVST